MAKDCLLVIMLLSTACFSATLSASETPGAPTCEARCAESETAAHLEAVKLYAPKAYAERREYGWNVCRKEDGTFAHSQPEVGDANEETGRTPPDSPSCRRLSSGHVHWNETLEFSGVDWQWVMANRVPLYLFNRAGELLVLDVMKVLSIRRNGRQASLRPNANYTGRLVSKAAIEKNDRGVVVVTP